MSEILNISNAYASLASTRLAPPEAGPAISQTLLPSGDTLELSRLGRTLSAAAAQSSFSIARTRAIRAEIQSGTYETPERIQGTVTRLVDVLG